MELVRDGHPAENVSAHQGVALLETMCRIRAFEEVAGDLARQGDLVGPVCSGTGHEAVAAGVGDRLGPDDHVVSSHRWHGHALAAGVPPSKLFAHLLGRSGSTCLADRSRRFLGGSVTGGGNAGIAAGTAAAHQLRGVQGAVVVFLGDDAPDAGAVLETLRLAARQRLPLLAVCANTGGRDLGRSPVDVATGLGVPAVVAEGNDVEEVATAAGGLLEEVRGGGGPRFLEALTYPRDGHDEARWWSAHDPIVLAGQTLVARGVPEESLPALRERARREMADAAAHARLAAGTGGAP